MNKFIKVEIGESLPPEIWLQVRDDLAQVFPIFGRILLHVNHDGKGKQDQEEFLMEAQLALQALTYVGNFAADKCRIIVLPDKNDRQ